MGERHLPKPPSLVSGRDAAGSARDHEILRNAMSVENLELVRSHFEAFNSGDIERCLEFWRDDVELVVSEALPEPGHYLGRDAAAAWFDNYFRSFEPGYTFLLEEIFGVAGDVVVIAPHHGIGRRSGIEISGESAYLYRVEDEKIARLALYRDRGEALEAAELRE
jgi:ketosteroid isomerase-like protein